MINSLYKELAIVFFGMAGAIIVVVVTCGVLYMLKPTEQDKTETKKNIEYCTKQANNNNKIYYSCMGDMR